VLTDAHCHPTDLARVFPQAEQERRRLSVTAAASSCDMEEFAETEELAHNAASVDASPLLPCFAIHPQLPAAKNADSEPFTETELNGSFETLHTLAKAGRIAAIGEFGFDLYNSSFRETESLQDRIFASHLETALLYGLPVVLHVRRAMHKIFAAAKTLSRCRAVIFHSWPGTYEEEQSLLRRSVNAYFSFGNIITLNHKQAQRSCALLPAERLLTETDAPFQPPRGEKFSQWANLPLIIEKAVSLRREAGINTDAKELEAQIEENFREVFNYSYPYKDNHSIKYNLLR
jgi:TatD DNase family protein